MISRLLWRIAYLQGDQAGMAANGALARRVAPDTDALLPLDHGHISRLRDAIQRIVTAEMQANHKENAAAAESALALTEALIGDLTEAKTSAMKAAQMSGKWDTLGPGGVALALAGDSAVAQKLAADLNQCYPQATRAQFYYLPAIRAALALRQDKPQQAIESLRNTSSYELLPGTGMIAVYLGGQANIDAHQGAQAAAEFQKILDRPVAALGSPSRVLADGDVTQRFRRTYDANGRVVELSIVLENLETGSGLAALAEPHSILLSLLADGQPPF